MLGGDAMQVVEGQAEQAEPEEEKEMTLDEMMAEAEAEEAAGTVAAKASGNIFAQTVDDPNMRKYDITITYDNYHRTPRMWLNGFDNDNIQLDQNAMLEDIMGDYANKTVTFEEHHNLPQKWLSIHPCNHANAMKSIIDTIIDNGGKPRVESSMFFFLKFISAVTPTIEYDFTIDLELD